MTINNNIFPPVLESYAPAFLINSGNSQKDTCRVYFSISLYNNISDIKNVQVTVVNQNTNLSVLNKNSYPCEIMLQEIKIDLEKETDDKYYIEIKNEDIEDGFQINQYYKVQIRFTSIDATNISLDVPQAIDSWLATNLSNFSEWSTICLIRGISVPSLNISGFDIFADTTLWSLNNVDVIGNLTFADSAETDTLKNYQIKLYNMNNELLSDTGILYTNNYSNINEFNYTLEYELNEGEEYYFIFEYETANLYKEKKTYEFMVVQESAESLNAIMTSLIDKENGRIGIKIKSKNEGDTFVGNITIRRTSSESNFKIWEDVHTESFEENSELNYTWWDYTIKSGVYYKYIAQKRSSVGNRGIAIHLQEEPVMILFDDIFLTGDGNQLKIKFDPSITSFKRTISESRTETIGNQYPFIKRNGYMNYRQFPIGGTITHLMDSDNLLTSRKEIFKDSLDNYNDFNKKNRINIFNDWTYEREFREKVMDFLYDNKIRLFRSATEGNILIKLMDINFTPNTTLGRRIYSFTATAYEVDDNTIKNYDKYGISSLGSYDTQLEFAQDYIGQLNKIIPSNKNAIEIIQDEYKKYVKENYLIQVKYLDFLRIEMEDKPYLIKEGAEGPYVVNDYGQEKENSENAILGYLIYINEKPVVINPEGIYELKGENVKVTSLSFPIDTKINLDYHVNINQIEDSSKVIKTNSFYKKVGQLWGAFKPNDSLYQTIWNKYFEKYSNYYQTMLSLDSIKIESNPGTVIYIKESGDSDFERHVIGPTHILCFDTEDSTIEGLYFPGVHLEEASVEERERENVPDNKYVETGIILDKYINDTSDLVKNGVYTLTDDYLETLNFFTDMYSFKSKEQWEDEYTASANRDNISQDNSDYILMLNRVYDFINEQGGISIEEEFIEQVGEDTWNGNLYINGMLDIENETQVNEENSEDLIIAGDKIYKDEYSFKSKEQWDNMHTASVNEDSMSKQDSTYTIKLDKVYDQFYNLVLNKDIDREYALLLQRLVDEANSRYIWYNNQWWLFTNNNDLLCPIEALIDYSCEIVKGRY